MKNRQNGFVSVDLLVVLVLVVGGVIILFNDSRPVCVSASNENECVTLKGTVLPVPGEWDKRVTFHYDRNTLARLGLSQIDPRWEGKTGDTTVIISDIIPVDEHYYAAIFHVRLGDLDYEPKDEGSYLSVFSVPTDRKGTLVYRDAVRVGVLPRVTVQRGAIVLTDRQSISERDRTTTYSIDDGSLTATH